MEKKFNQGDTVVRIISSNEAINVGEKAVVTRVAADGALLINGFFMLPEFFEKENKTS